MNTNHKIIQHNGLHLVEPRGDICLFRELRGKRMFFGAFESHEAAEKAAETLNTSAPLASFFIATHGSYSIHQGKDA